MTERKPMSQKPRQFRFPTRVTLGVLALAQAIVVGGVRTQAADDEPPTIDSLSVKMVSIAPATSAPAPAKPPASPELVAAIRAETEAMNARLKSLKDWTVRGIVCDPDGKPVADAEVVYYSFDRTCEPRNVWTDRVQKRIRSFVRGVRRPHGCSIWSPRVRSPKNGSVLWGTGGRQATAAETCHGTHRGDGD